MTSSRNLKKSTIILVVFGSLILIGLLLGIGTIVSHERNVAQEFDGNRAYRDVEYQVGLGSRTPGSQAHRLVQEWIKSELETAEWKIETQEMEFLGQTIQNIIATRGEGSPWVVLGAHYDSRIFADNDPTPENHSLAVPGANDGASGVAVLLELARILPQNLPVKISLVFFDAEDNGNIPGWEWIMGSTAYVKSLRDKPDMAIILDMIGDADLNIHYERNSDPALSQEIWQIAHDLGYGDKFIKSTKYSILDDHIPFLQAGIPAVDIIDFDYPYWHTIEDTPDKVSPDSLKAVGDTMRSWLLNLRD